MKEIKLLKISYHNFKGIKDFEFDLNGNNINISGDNAVGKTSLFDGFLWLLFGKNSEEQTKFNPKPLDENGNEVLGLEPEIEAVLQIDGEKVTLRRKLSEVWAKPRGQVEKVRKSDKTELYVDQVPYKLKDYSTYVNSIIDEDTFKLLTNPMAFNNLKWQERRKILLSLIDDVNDDDVIKQTKYANELKRILDTHTAEEQRKIIASQRHKLRSEIDGIPARIDEANRAIPETSTTSKAALQAMLADYQKQLVTEQANLQAVGTSNDSLDARHKKAELESTLSTKQNSYLQGSQLAVANLSDDLNKARMDSSKAQTALKVADQKINSLNAEIEQETKTRTDMLTEYHELIAQEFDDSSLVCPTCGQTYPEEKQAELKDKFNANLSQRKAEIIDRGKQVADTLKAHKAELEETKSSYTDLLEESELRKQQLDQLNNEYNRQQSSIIPFEKTKIYADLQAQIVECDEQINSGSGKNDAAKQAVQTKITQINAGISQVNDELAKYETADKQKQRIDELKATEKELKQTYSQLDKQSFMLDEYVRTKVAVLETRINSLFGIVNFKLFETQKNGELNDICEAMVDGVPYSTDLNNAARINAGLDIINTLSKHYDVTAPIFVDNAESINQIIETKAQQIKLIVSKNKKLVAKMEA